ncbi:MAG: hypothetical protein Q9222_005294 [Ikaeria aurantiellina]
MATPFAASMSAPWPQSNHIDSFFPPRIGWSFHFSAIRGATDNHQGAITSTASNVDDDGRWRKRRKTDLPEVRSPTVDGNVLVSGQRRPSTTAHSTLLPSRVQRIAIDQPGSTPADPQIEWKQLRVDETGHENIKAPSVVIEDSVTAKSLGKEPSVDPQESLGDTTTITEVLDRGGALPVKLIKARPDGKLTSPRTLKRRDRRAEDPHSRIPPIATKRKDPKRQGDPCREGSSTPAGPPDNVAASTLVTTPSVPDIIQSTRPSLREATPPKKLMKIRSDGKLTSPSYNAPLALTPTKRRGRPRKNAPNVKEKIVTMKYGKTSELRLTIGKRIEDILANICKFERLEDPGRPAERPSEAMKATHPFFLGKHRWKPEANISGLGNNEKAEPTDNGENDVNPVKTKSSRNILTRVNAKPWTDLGVSEPYPTKPSGYTARALRGAHDHLWPPQDMVHIRPEIALTIPPAMVADRGSIRLPNVSRLKSTESHVRVEEEVMHHLIRLSQACETGKNRIGQTGLRSRQLRIPLRRVITGLELQNLYKAKNMLPPPGRDRSLKPQHDYVDELEEAEHQPKFDHAALRHLYERIPSSRTAFDQFECESQCWTTKYVPQMAEDVLQPGREALVLRDWLRSLVVNTVESGSHDAGQTKESSRMFMKPHAGNRKRKRVRAQELDGFVVSSDDEANEMDELHDGNGMHPSRPENHGDTRSVIKVREVPNVMSNSGSGERSTNAIVISGPSGSGKTVAVYAAAQELGFEIFEINAGSRRSGKDIFDKVGDMSRNHLVSQVKAREAAQTQLPEDRMSPSTNAPNDELESHRQGKMNAFLKPKMDKKRSPKKDKRLKQEDAADQPSRQRSQKQSVILLEEVDLLFEDDKQFWAATIELITQSKRPVIMTCTDESLLPLEDLSLFGILRFVKPPDHLAIEYLQLLACNEGHLLSKDAISALYRVKRNDLRASITELQFYCQMAVGDTKGGLEWMLVQPLSDKTEQSASTSKRVVSEGTYLKGMGWSNHEQGGYEPDRFIDYEMDLLKDICGVWKIDLAEEDDFLPIESIISKSATSRGNLGTLNILDMVYDSLSAADTYRCQSFQEELNPILDCSAPKMSDKDSINYTEGVRVLQADLVEDPGGVSESIAAALRVFARRSLLNTAEEQRSNLLDEQFVADDLPNMLHARLYPKPVSSQTLSKAFVPLSRPSLGPLAGRGPLISSFDSPVAVVVEDIAPYVRTIVSYDLRLEEQRKQLDVVSHGGQNGKRGRTTRASRAALEGGSKANTRRERWFPVNTDFRSVLRTGRSEWQEEMLQRSSAEGSNEDGNLGASRRSSITSVPSGA